MKRFLSNAAGSAASALRTCCTRREGLRARKRPHRERGVAVRAARGAYWRPIEGRCFTRNAAVYLSGATWPAGTEPRTPCCFCAVGCAVRPASGVHGQEDSAAATHATAHTDAVVLPIGPGEPAGAFLCTGMALPASRALLGGDTLVAVAACWFRRLALLRHSMHFMELMRAGGAAQEPRRSDRACMRRGSENASSRTLMGRHRNTCSSQLR